MVIVPLVETPVRGTITHLGGVWRVPRLARHTRVPDWTRKFRTRRYTMEKLLIAMAIVSVTVLAGLSIAQAAMATPQFHFLVGALR